MVSSVGLTNQFSVRGEFGRVSTCHTSTHQIASHVHAGPEVSEGPTFGPA
jgi:hypothetical protein